MDAMTGVEQAALVIGTIVLTAIVFWLIVLGVGAALGNYDRRDFD